MRKIIALLCLLFVLPVSTYAAPPPNEVEEKKQKSTLIVTAEVIDDLLLEDISTSKSHPSQTREMVLLVHEILKQPEDLNLHTNHKLNVQYHYIPSWNINQYVGPSRVDITKGDIIKIWLVKGENSQWRPTLSGSTIEHIRYVDKRNEPISEPSLHEFIRTTSTLWTKHQSMIVLAGIIILNILIVIGGLKLRSKQSKMQ
ncbi:hypothetical protein IMZ08_05125 [Bacillus luteolus]|uniref:Uncharacterized protein n=1 Tax=Litchfieldia luteola TaxID=682179 RepID=A0ABR9QG25_9BACI|nr:hypothetical protein [Cytobacillus luteolus]MBE4907445.1 hypothetical protein [Cytobacillus luteolus]MBP1944212.1 hypothetical protein [Cytobacillus luteolus]